MYLKFQRANPKREEFFIEVDAYRVVREEISTTDPETGVKTIAARFTELQINQNGDQQTFLLADATGKSMIEGLEPESRGDIWSACYAQNDAGKTIDTIRPLAS